MPSEILRLIDEQLCEYERMGVRRDVIEVLRNIFDRIRSVKDELEREHVARVFYSFLLTPDPHYIYELTRLCYMLKIPLSEEEVKKLFECSRGFPIG